MPGIKLAENIKILRKRNKMTQADMAAKLDITRHALSTYERGIREPHIAKLWEMADLFDISIDELVGRKPLK